MMGIGLRLSRCLTKRKASTSDISSSNIISPLFAGLEAGENDVEYEDTTADDKVFIVPEQSDLLWYLNHSPDNNNTVYIAY